jgi:hypothetical protein
VSKEGLKKAAAVFDLMQQTRDELLRMGSENPGTNTGKQDIKLGQLFYKANEAIKEEFSLITMMETGEA